METDHTPISFFRIPFNWLGALRNILPEKETPTPSPLPGLEGSQAYESIWGSRAKDGDEDEHEGEASKPGSDQRGFWKPLLNRYEEILRSFVSRKRPGCAEKNQAELQKRNMLPAEPQEGSHILDEGHARTTNGSGNGEAHGKKSVPVVSEAPRRPRRSFEGQAQYESRSDHEVPVIDHPPLVPWWEKLEMKDDSDVKQTVTRTGNAPLTNGANPGSRPRTI
ncbi:hypothetical protein N0V82_002485 [Gnomoniopsis sp. IMI 355080]|nr:hypothetical protein N0V82_002485 [Gnomoniopsis sp. IMI 355080]